MKPELKEFFEKLAADSQLQDKMAQCKSADEAYKLASEIQEGFTMEEFQNAMQQVQNASMNGTELSAEDLEGVAGGIETVTWITGGITVVAKCASAAM